MDIAERLANEFSGPIIFDYVWWVLREAQMRGIKRLYFLARDGYTLLRVAQIMCEEFSLPIDCRYLYCSRIALRMPTFHFIGSEAFELLFLWGYQVTMKSLLSRGGLEEDERRAVLCDLGRWDIDEDQPLTKVEFDGYEKLLRQNALFRRYVDEHSRAAYESTIGYLRQEGLFNRDFAVVDSGWTGSMQRSLRQLLEREGYGDSLCGFYFGMYDKPRNAADGEYLTWFFDAGGKVRDKAIFCNNLFEGILAAPHGMTVGYREEKGQYEPVLMPSPAKNELERVERQSDAIAAYSAERIKITPFSAFDGAALQRDTTQRVCRYMSWPTQEEASYYGGFLFCDDMTDEYRQPLAAEEQLNRLRYCLLPGRAVRKLTGWKDARTELLWPCGTAAFLPSYRRWWYRLNILAWEYAKYLILQTKQRARK